MKTETMWPAWMTQAHAQMLAIASAWGLTGGVPSDTLSDAERRACYDLCALDLLVYTYMCYTITPKGQALDQELFGPETLPLGITSSWNL